MAKMTDSEALVLLAEDEGYDDTWEFIEEVGLDSVMPGICVDEDCAFTVTRCEPDMREGWCEGCGKQTVQSAMVLAGLI